MKLLRGERDEQRLAGLLLVTKVCSKDDHSAIRQVYHAVGPKFLYRLLRTGRLISLSDFIFLFFYFSPLFYFGS